MAEVIIDCDTTIEVLVPDANAINVTIVDDVVNTTAEMPSEIDLITYEGLPGKSAYQIALEEGFVGSRTEWLASLVGLSGTPSSSLGYTHNQMTPDNVWIINHPLPFTPNITVVDTAGTSVEGQVDYITSSQVALTFSAPFSGSAHLS